MNIVDVAQEKEMLDEVRDLHQGFRTLTPQEHKVFLYVISGLMNKQIADVLNIKEHNVKVHRGRVMEKLGADSLAELARLSEKSSILP